MASDAARASSDTRDASGLEYVEATVEAALTRAGAAAEVIVVNPPRAGLSHDVIDGLCSIGAERLVYVSCDPGTLARDVERLGGSWTATRIQPFDAFPHTGHVETVLWFERRMESPT